MRLSTRSLYGIRAMMELASEYGKGPVLLRDIVERQHLPTTYLEQLMLPLRKARIVSATRGVNGGYVLLRDPGSLTLAELIDVLEGPLEFEDCSSIACCHMDPNKCALKSVLTEAGQRLVDYFSTITLSELVLKQHAMAQDQSHALVLRYTL